MGMVLVNVKALVCYGIEKIFAAKIAIDHDPLWRFAMSTAVKARWSAAPGGVGPTKVLAFLSERVGCVVVLIRTGSPDSLCDTKIDFFEPVNIGR
jgi:hypothetical protein